MIRKINIHDMEHQTAMKIVRDAIDTIGKNILVFIHGYGASSGSYKKLQETRNIGKSRIKKGQITLCISGADLNDPINRIHFNIEDLSQLNKYMVNSGVTIIKK